MQSSRRSTLAAPLSTQPDRRKTIIPGSSSLSTADLKAKIATLEQEASKSNEKYLASIFRWKERCRKLEESNASLETTKTQLQSEIANYKEKLAKPIPKVVETVDHTVTISKELGVLQSSVDELSQLCLRLGAII
ncbi:hypothetical protein RCL1_005718 [Eukaryota sp. TZLM3-RCL]